MLSFFTYIRNDEGNDIVYQFDIRSIAHHYQL
jgi:hypothetical protein